MVMNLEVCLNNVSRAALVTDSQTSDVVTSLQVVLNLRHTILMAEAGLRWRGVLRKAPDLISLLLVPASACNAKC